MASITPVAVILFGSAVHGQMTNHSDIDILIICDDPFHIHASMKALVPHRPLCSYAMDIIWMTLADYQRKKDMGGIAYVASREGRFIIGDPI